MPSQTFSSSGSFTVPGNFLSGSLGIYCKGEGGNGGASLHGSHSGGGGGGGAEAAETGSSVNSGVTGGTVLTITIGTGGTGTATSVTGAGVTVTANAGSNATGQLLGSGGAAGSNTVAFAGGDGGSGVVSASTPGGGGGGSAGDTGAGGSGLNNNGGGAGSGSVDPGAAGPNGGGALSSGINGNAPGSGASGGGSGGSVNHAGGTGAAGQVIITWQTFVPFQAAAPRMRYAPAISALLISRRVQRADFVAPISNPFHCDAPRYLQVSASRIVRRDKGASPTGWPIPVQPPEIPSSEHARFKPPYPRRGVTITQFPTPNIPPTESYRARFKPPWPRRGVVAPTGWPVPVQPIEIPRSVHERTFRQLFRQTARTTDTFTPFIVVQPPWSSWVYKRRWSKPPFPRRGVVPPEGLPPPPIVTFYNPTYERRPQRYQWFRKGFVAPTGWPIPVQPPMLPGPYGIRRYSRPLWPRRGVTKLPVPLNQPPAPTSERRWQKYQWFRKGNAQPNTGLPVPVQPVEIPHSLRAVSRFILRRKGNVPPEAATHFMPIQPPERMQSMRRWSPPPWPRRGRTEIATLAGPQLRIGYQPLTVQTFTYIPGAAGVDLTTLNLLLFQLNSNGFSFWNQYGDVIFVVYNNTPLDVTVQPNVIRTIELQSVQISASVLHPGAMQAFGPFPPNDFTNRSLAYIMTVAVQANSSGVYAGAFRMVPAPPTGHTGQYDLLGGRLRRLISLAEQQHNSSPGEIYPGDTTPGA